jgi:hypothetical protein
MTDDTRPSAGDAAPDEPPSARRPSTGRTGLKFGILVAVLVALLFYFYWRSTGADEAERASPPAATTKP